MKNKCFTIFLIIFNSFIICEELTFQTQMFKKIHKLENIKSKENILISPLSLYQLISLLSNGANEMTQQETSQLLGMSQVQVSRNESKILKKLRTRL